MVDLYKLPLVSLINPHTMLGCLYCVRGVWRRATCQYPTQYILMYQWDVCIVSEECGGGPLVSILH